MFSVIIPLYNKENTVTRAIMSVLQQTYQKFEIIIVNDGSTDNSLEVVKNIDDPRLIIVSQQNGGVSSARNKGIKTSHNELLAFLDADDEWEIDFLESIDYLIAKYPKCGMYATGRFERSNLKGENRMICSKENLSKDFIIKEYLAEPYIIQMSSMCVRKSIVEEIGYFPLNIKIGEDVDFKLRIACKNKIAYFNEPKTIYYLAAENNSFSYTCRLGDIFPYWKWLFYPYKNKVLLFKYTVSKMCDTIKRVYFPYLFKKRIPQKI